MYLKPVMQDEKLHMAFYAADVACYADSLVRKTGLMNMGQQQLPMNVARQRARVW